MPSSFGEKQVIRSEPGLAQKDELDHLSHMVLQQGLGLFMSQAPRLALMNDPIDVLSVRAGKIFGHFDSPPLSHESEINGKLNPPVCGDSS
jgi:hypothetical protein